MPFIIGVLNKILNSWINTINMLKMKFDEVDYLMLDRLNMFNKKKKCTTKATCYIFIKKLNTVDFQTIYDMLSCITC